MSMKRLFSKKSGFTLVEIVIAFAVFAIFAAMIMSTLELAIQRRQQNNKYEEDLYKDAENIVAKERYNDSDKFTGQDGEIALNFENGETIKFGYQLKDLNDPDGGTAGVNYFVADGIKYDAKLADSTYDPGEDPDNPDKDPSELGGSSVMTRFDTRITGTKGISSIRISWTTSGDGVDTLYTFNVQIDDSGVDSSRKDNAQVTLFFGEDAPNGAVYDITELNGGDRSYETLKKIKKVGKNGVNLHRPDGGFAGKNITFTVKFNGVIEKLGFGSNLSGGSYTSTGNANIYGAYDKNAPAESGDE